VIRDTCALLRSKGDDCVSEVAPTNRHTNNAAVSSSQNSVVSPDGFGPKSLASLQKAKGPQERFTVPETHQDMVLDGENAGVDPQLLAVVAS
jgi:hypothetical protein